MCANSMLDLHCHLLPGVDDGAPDIETSLTMARTLVAAGFSAVAPSPHYGEGPGGDVPIAVADSRRELVREALASAEIPLEMALERKVGARSLRAVMETAMLDIMYRLPVREDVAAVRITKGVIDGTDEAVLTLKEIDDTHLKSESA